MASSPLTPLTASSMLSAIGCEKFQIAPGIFLQLRIHRRDQLVFVLMEDRPPFFLRLQIDEVLGVEEARRVGAVVRTADLAGHDSDLGKRGEKDSHLVRHADAFGRAGAGRKRAAHPDRAFVEMRQELRPDRAAEQYATRTEPRRAIANVAQRQSMARASARAYARVSRPMSGLCHSFVPFGKTRLASTGPTSIENIKPPSSANATVQAIGLNSRPSTACSVKIGMYATMMMAME